MVTADNMGGGEGCKMVLVKFYVWFRVAATSCGGEIGACFKCRGQRNVVLTVDGLVDFDV